MKPYTDKRIDKNKANIQTLITNLTQILGPRLDTDWRSAQLIEGLAQTYEFRHHLAHHPADESAIQRTDSYIMQHRKHLDRDTITRLIDAIGTFLGACIITRCGGHWIQTDEGPAIRINQALTVFPFRRVRACFLETGFGYSMRNLFLTAQSGRPPTKIDASFLPQGYQIGGDQGVVAEFYEDGQLRTLRHYVDGDHQINWELHLYYGVERGYVSRAHISQHFTLGSYSTDAHMDMAGIKEYPCDFVEWIQKWIDIIAHPENHRDYMS